MNSDMSRECCECGADISDRGSGAQRCKPCAAAREKARKRNGRAHKRGISARKIAAALLVQRDGKVCHICGQDINLKHGWNFDHVLPRNAYPQLELEPWNIRLAHKNCNITVKNGKIPRSVGVHHL